MSFPMRALFVSLLLVMAAAPTVAEDEATEALTWHYEGFAAISKAANEAKVQGKRLLLGLSGGST